MSVSHTVQSNAMLFGGCVWNGAAVVAMLVTAIIALFAPQASAAIVNEESVTPVPLSPQELAKLELESEVLFRCMLFYEAEHVMDLRMLWISLLVKTALVNEPPHDAHQVRFDVLKGEMLDTLAMTRRYALDTAVLHGLLSRSYGQFDFVQAIFEIQGILVALEVVTVRILEYADVNNERLRSENPAAFKARIPEDCSKFIERP